MARNKRKVKVDRQDNVTEISNPHVETIENVQKSPACLPSRKKVMQIKRVRRSGRLLNLQPRAANKGMPTEEIELDDGEEEKEEPLVEQVNSEPPPAGFGGSKSKIVTDEKEEVPLDERFNSEHIPIDIDRMESKIDFLVQSVKEFKSQGVSSSETSNVEDKYRSLYFKSQKKIEELTKENQELANNLELTKQKNEMVNVTMALTKANETIAIFTSHFATSKPNLVEGTTPCDAPGSVAANGNNHGVPSSSKKYPRRKK